MERIMGKDYGKLLLIIAYFPLFIVDRALPSGILKLMSNTSPAELLAGSTGDAALLFFDIRQFSTMAEKMSPQELLCSLNDHLELVTQVCSHLRKQHVRVPCGSTMHGKGPSYTGPMHHSCSLVSFLRIYIYALFLTRFLALYLLTC